MSRVLQGLGSTHFRANATSDASANACGVAHFFRQFFRFNSQTNSQFFSAVAPARALTNPDITVQMPVYREGLEAVILPSIVSLEVRKNVEHAFRRNVCGAHGACRTMPPRAVGIRRASAQQNVRPVNRHDLHSQSPTIVVRRANHLLHTVELRLKHSRTHTNHYLK